MRYPLIVYRKELPRGVTGDTLGPLIRIQAGYEGDEGLYRHQLRHVIQWLAVALVAGATMAALAGALLDKGSQLPLLAALAGGVVAFSAHGLLYRYVTPYRLIAELDAYRVQMRYPFRNGSYLPLEQAAEKLADPRYKLGIGVDQARALLDR